MSPCLSGGYVTVTCGMWGRGLGTRLGMCVRGQTRLGRWVGQA